MSQPDDSLGPQWFRDALAQSPELGTVEVEGAEIETRAWGERGRPGLLLIHGAAAHAGWWDFVAPLLAEDFRVAAFSLSGMGGSSWRERYSLDLYAQEAFAVAQAAGLFEGPMPPVFAAHSFGGRVVLRCAAGSRANELKAAVVIDSLMRPPGSTPRARPFDRGSARIYPTEAAALARFRLVPAQDCAYSAMFDYIARSSVREVKDEAGQPGWTWRFDPDLWNRLDDDRPSVEDLRAARCPVAAIRGARSVLVTPELADYFKANAPAGTPMVVVPEAHHHLIFDQPLALVAALRGLLAGWPAGGAGGEA